MATKINKLARQNIFDISVQASGTIENVNDILAANELGYADGLPSQVHLPAELLLNKKTNAFYNKKSITPGTELDPALSGIGISGIGVDFTIGD